MTVPGPIRPIAPPAITIAGARALPRPLHTDRRGFLVETLRRDDSDVDGGRFAMSYSSLTLPGQFRDADRWHVHRRQTDRFVVPLGEMTLALLDARASSPTHGRLEVIALDGPTFDPSPASAGEGLLYLVPIPPGVYHCIGNLSTRPFLLTNFPTEMYDPGDEGRVPFTDAPVPGFPGGFAWEKVGPRAGTDRA